MIYEVQIAGGKSYRIELRRSPGDQWQCSVDGEPVELDAALGAHGVLSLLLEGRSYECKLDAAMSQVSIAGRRYDFEVRDPRSLRARRRSAAGTDGPRKIAAPMPGKVVRVLAPQGTEVEAGQGVVVIEAMKMQNELKSPKKGKVSRIAAAEGATVNAGDTLAVIE